MHGDEQQVYGIVLPEGFQHVHPAGGEQPSPVLLHGGGQTGCAYAEGDHLVVLIHDETGGVGVDQRREFGSILFDLFIRQIHRAVQRGVGHVHQVEKRLQQRQIRQPALGLHDVQMVALEHEVRQLLPPPDGFLVGGHGDELLDPVHVLHVAQRRHVVDVVGVIIVCKEAAAAVEALHQHALTVHVGEAQRPMHRGAAQLPRPVLHGGEQRSGYLGIVDKVHLGEPHPVGAPLFIGLAAADGADAPHDLPVPFRQPAPRVAVGERRIFLTVPVGQVIAIRGGHELRYAAVQLIGIIHEPAQLRLRGHFYNRNHNCSS